MGVGLLEWIASPHRGEGVHSSYGLAGAASSIDGGADLFQALALRIDPPADLDDGRGDHEDRSDKVPID